MAILARRASDVYFNEVNLSSFITASSTGSVAQVLVSGKGPVDPTRFTSLEEYLRACGQPNAATTFDHYMAIEYFREGNQLWVSRALGTGYKTAGLVVKNSSTGLTALSPISAGLTDPLNPDWASIVGVSDTALFVVYPKWGPGSYGNRIAVSLESKNLQPPTSIAGTTSPTGGFLPDASYDYVVSALSVISTTTTEGESIASSPNTFVLASATSTNKINLTWTPVLGAVGYKIYRKQTSATNYDLVATVGAATAAYSDTGTDVPDATKHPILSSGGLYAPQTTFTLKIYDLDVATSTPVETFNVSLNNQVDESGSQLEVEYRINAYSEYVQVRSHASALVSIPGVTTASSIIALEGGTSGSAPTSSNINAAWEKFINKELYSPDILMEWRSSDSVRKYVASLAERRNDCTAFLATPSGSQDANKAIDDRNLSLNLNSTFAAVFTSDHMISDTVNGKQIWIPPVGAAAALYARTVRIAQPWFSIAGPNRGKVPNTLRLRKSYNEAEATNLVSAQVNYFRTMSGKGTMLWEQFTCASASSALQYLNVRFLLNILKRSLYSYLVEFLQEQNDEILRRQIAYGLDSFLSVVKAGRGISNYRVVINDSNNPTSYAASGILGIAIYIVPIIPAREIRLTFVVGQQGSITISEDEIATLSLA